MKTKTVVFIHGMFMTPTCWSGWVQRFRERGLRALAPAWPLHDAPPQALRDKHPDPALGKLTLDEVVAEMVRTVEALDEKPILIGHSMGGLVVQLLLQKQLGVAGVAIDSAPPKGVISFKWSFIKSNWPVVSPFANKDQPYLLTPSDFRYAFAHTLPPDELKATYDREVVPESRRVGNGPTTAVAKIDFTAARPPLLFVAGELDRIIPASLNASNHKKYAASAGITEIRQFPGRTHYTLGQEGWESIADFVLDWTAQYVG
ncbi:MAG TPA: alpha/beta hydrolase [Kofleriaceae bacterium]|nr:alpha/beta hydrolase [Kofleriaceae bacterium]